MLPARRLRPSLKNPNERAVISRQYFCIRFEFVEFIEVEFWN